MSDGSKFTDICFIGYTSKVLMNFSQIAGGKRAHMHPVLSKLVDDEVLGRMNASAE